MVRVSRPAIPFVLVLLLGLFLMLTGCKRGAEAGAYHCPMHPTYVSDKQGDCPICGMRLVPIPKDKAGEASGAGPAADAPSPAAPAQATTDTYVCPMHPEVMNPTPGDCPKCGMKLEKQVSKAPPAEAGATYACPMHPEVTAGKPDKCPKCGMFLEKQAAATADTFVCPMHPEVMTPTQGFCPKCGMKLEKKVSQAPKAEAGATYACPMHPEVTAGKPDKCPKCGMFLEKQAAATTDTFICPMHPEVMTPTQGFCPKCGMKLEKKVSKAPPAEAGATYACPMHPEVTAGKPDKCPKCGMFLEKVKSSSQAPQPATSPDQHASATAYACPMHPEVVSAQPGKCSKCGMDLVSQASQDVGSRVPVQLEPEGIKLANIQTVEATRQTLTPSVRTVGTVVPDEARVRHIHTRVSGWVQRLFVNTTGQKVSKGQPILSLYSPELLASQEELIRATQSASRLKDSIQPELQQTAKALVEAARERLRLFEVPEATITALEKRGTVQRELTLTSPISGIVLSKQLVEGHQVTPGGELFVVADLSRVWVEAEFFEREAGLLQEGRLATLTSPYDQLEPIQARISYIYPYVNPQTRTLRVRFEVANADLRLKPDMALDVRLQGLTTEGVVVPDTALMDTGTRKVVFVEPSPGRFEPRLVKVGIKTDGRAQVLSGLEAGEKVVVRGNFLLDSESRLRAALAGMTGYHTH